MEKLTVEDLMTADVIKVSTEDDLETVQDLMDENRIRHLPVVDEEDAVVGLVSHRDLVSTILSSVSALPLSQLRELLSATRVREIMVTEVETVDPTEDAEEAGRMLLINKFGCLPVTENGKLVGILTESDFVRYVVDELSEASMREVYLRRVAL